MRNVQSAFTARLDITRSRAIYSTASIIDKSQNGKYGICTTVVSLAVTTGLF